MRAWHLPVLAFSILLSSCGGRNDSCDESRRWSLDRADDLARCAERGHRESQVHFGRLLALDGQAAASRLWLELAADDRGGKGALWVAESLASYKDVSGLAEEWYVRAHALGHRDAAFRLGMLHHNAGHDVEANRWFERAFVRDGASAAARIALMLRRKDEPASTAWYRRAAEMGDVRSMGDYAHRLAEGIGVPKDPADAFRWRLRAAKHPKADGYDLLALARAYDQGVGTTRDSRAALTTLRAAKGKRIDDSDTKTPAEMKEMEDRLETEVART